MPEQLKKMANPVVQYEALAARVEFQDGQEVRTSS
jgi:hypothetical protein